MPQDVERMTKRQGISATESLMEVEAFHLEIQVVIGPEAYDSIGAQALGVRRVDGSPVDFEAHLPGVLLGVDLQEIGSTSLSISLLDGGACRPALADLTGVRSVTTLDQILPVIPNQEIHVPLIPCRQVLPAKEETVALGVLQFPRLIERRQRVEGSLGPIRFPGRPDHPAGSTPP